MEWFKNYLNDRKQFTLYNGVESERQDLVCGVPQGSVLGPLLFIIYINDLPNSLKVTSAIMFADDSTIYKSHSNLRELFSVANTDLALLSEWFKSNKLLLNPSKTKYILFHHARKTPNTEGLELQINNETLQRTHTAKFLGIYIDDNWKWNNHIDHILTKVARSLYLLRTTRKYVYKEDLKTLCYTIIYPYITFGIEVWGCANKALLDRILHYAKASYSLYWDGSLS